MERGNVDVVVVGAGPAGLRAACLLQDAGRSVVVLEARDRIGGRLLSDKGFDLGATWFWPDEHRVNNLVRELQLDVFTDGNNFGRFQNGAQSLAEALARALSSKIRLSEPVESISINAGDRLEVITTNSVWLANHVILAVPPATAVSNIRMDQLSAAARLVASVTPVWMGSTVKIVAHFKHRFWRDSISMQSRLGPLHEIHDMSGPDGSRAAILGFAQPGPGAAAPEREAILNQLVNLFGSEAAAPIHLWIQDWRQERYTVSEEAIGLSDYETYGHISYQKPDLGGRLHWASTETSQEAGGHIEGALAAAERAFKAIMEA